MFKKMILAALVLASATVFTASATAIQDEALTPLAVESVILSELTGPNSTDFLNLQLAGVSCSQCYADHQVCIQVYPRPYCRQQLADCREDCQ